jgi:hypothetical protein
MSIRDILMAIALFVNGASGHSALRLSRDLKCAYRTAYILLKKLRHVLGSMQANRKLTGDVEVDGAYFGGHIKKTNLVKNRRDRRTSNPKRQSIVSLRERRRGGRTLSFAFHTEKEGVAAVLAHVHRSAQVYTDQGSHWSLLDECFDKDIKRVNHSIDGYSVDASAPTSSRVSTDA